MKTYQLKFLAWVFSAFLPPDDPDAERDDYYELLGVAPNANADDIKKAYRKRSLQVRQLCASFANVHIMCSFSCPVHLAPP